MPSPSRHLHLANNLNSLGNTQLYNNIPSLISNSSFQMNYDSKEFKDSKIGVEGFCKEKYQTAPLRVLLKQSLKKNECNCQADSYANQDCENDFCKYSTSPRKQKMLVMKELESCFEKLKLNLNQRHLFSQ